MAVSWKCVEVVPVDLQKTLEGLTDERWRILSVNVTPDIKHESDVGWTTHSPGTFTVVGYRMVYEKDSRRRGNDYDPKPTQ